MGWNSGDRTTSRGASPRTRLYVVLASPLAAVLVIEAVVRLHWRTGPRPTREEGVLLRPHMDPRIRLENAPGAVQRLVYDGGFSAAPIEVEARINAQGFRGPTVSLPKTPGVFRIACVGDSHTFGHGVDEQGTWPRALQRSLDHELGTRRVEVMNWGVNGYDTEQELALLEERVSRYEPDLVLLQFFANDTVLHSLVRATDELDSTAPASPGWLDRLARYSRIAEFTAARMTRRAKVDHFRGGLLEQFDDDFPGWIRCRELLKATQARLGPDQIEFAVVLYPLLVEYDGSMLSHAPLERVDAFCREQSIRCWNIECEFEHEDLDRLRVHPLDFHANAHAHDIFGRAVARRLLEAGLLSSATGPNAALSETTARGDRATSALQEAR